MRRELQCCAVVRVEVVTGEGDKHGLVRLQVADDGGNLPCWGGVCVWCVVVWCMCVVQGADDGGNLPCWDGQVGG